MIYTGHGSRTFLKLEEIESKKCLETQRPILRVGSLQTPVCGPILMCVYAALMRLKGLLVTITIRGHEFREISIVLQWCDN